MRLETSTFPMSQTRAEPGQLLPRRFLHSPPGTSEWETAGQIPAEPKTNTWNWSPNSFSCEKPPTNLQLPGWAGFKLPREEDKLERFYQLKAEGHKVGNLTIVTGRCKRPQMWPCSLGRYGPSAWSPPALRSQNFQPLSRSPRSARPERTFLKDPWPRRRSAVALGGGDCVLAPPATGAHKKRTQSQPTE